MIGLQSILMDAPRNKNTVVFVFAVFDFFKKRVFVRVQSCEKNSGHGNIFEIADANTDITMVRT